MTITKRLLYYLLLAGLCIVLPYVLTIILIIITGDRYDGMKFAVFPGLISAQFIFGLTFIKENITKKIILDILLTGFILGLVWLGMTMGIINTGIDSYQFWDLALTNFIAGLITWEIFYQIDSRLKLFRKENVA